MRVKLLLALALSGLAVAAPAAGAAVRDGAVVYSQSVQGPFAPRYGGIFAGERQLTTEPEDGGMAVSPDGETIAFSRRGDLYVVGIGPGGLPLAQVTGGPEWDGAPVFSPDGSRILFERAELGSGVVSLASDLYLTGLGGGVAVQVTDGARDREAVFSPDGRQIVFVRSYPDAAGRLEPGDLYSVRPSGERLARLTRTPGRETRPHFSRAGIVFSRRSAEGGLWRILAMNRDGTEPRRLVPEDKAVLLDVSPDGRRLLYRVGDPMRVRGLGRRAGLAAGRPIGLAVKAIAPPIFSPSGTKVATSVWDGELGKVLIRDLRSRTTRFLDLADTGVENPQYRSILSLAWQPLPGR